MSKREEAKRFLFLPRKHSVKRKILFYSYLENVCKFIALIFFFPCFSSVFLKRLQLLVIVPGVLGSCDLKTMIFISL